MNLRDLIANRRTVHNFTSERVDDGLVVEALRLSLWAPNHRLTFPWVYRELGPEVRGRLAELAVDLKRAKGPVSEVTAKAIYDSVVTPSHVISLGVARSTEASKQHEDYATLACSVQIASLFLWEHGIATKWTTSGWSRHARAYGLIGVDPAAVVLEGALIIGRAQIVPEASERPALEKVFQRLK